MNELMQAAIYGVAGAFTLFCLFPFMVFQVVKVARYAYMLVASVLKISTR